MGKQRFREVKQAKHTSKKEHPPKTTRPYAHASTKIKAFLTDSFMLLMPVLYVVIYFIMGGREGFSDNKLLGWAYIFVPLILVQTLFMLKTSQTPGYRAYNIEVIDEHTGKRPSFFLLLFRNTSAVLSFFTVFGWLMMFFRKDAKTLHDLLSNTAITYKINAKK
ncbi:MAG: RDD family protein [uncultured Sulfurovum sp.]|uniref:RDD family protein n=1 Tax=uncultured Sulfurovum sp. TaxID=269237 RepID=A0A6S6UHK9_9BACT|nr:MAG: RDD family protein [uncultured Sulfurovum sp.]